MLRTALDTVSNVDVCVRRIHAGALAPSASLVHHDSCAADLLNKAQKDFDSTGLRRDLQIEPRICICKVPQLQLCIYNYLLPIRRPFSLQRMLEDNFARWFDEEGASIRAARAIDVLGKIHKHVPPCVLFSLIAAWCNAWCTAARFQGTDTCFICMHCEDEDSLEHYAVCEYQIQVFVDYFGRDPGECTLSLFLVLDECSLEDMIFHACHLYAVKSAIDLRHHENKKTDIRAVNKLIWTGHRTAAIYSKSLARRYRSIWT